MKHIINNNNSPYVNMAIEEYVLTHLSRDDDCFMLWQNSPAIIIGRHQNAWEEINTDFIKENDIALVRRLTGGGAVYHDLGNINFTFVVRDGGKGFDFQRFARPIVEALGRLGIKAEASGRNDILIGGHKFSGNSEYRQGNRLLHHGTLLFDSDLGVLGQALRVKPQKIASKGIKSVRSRVTNISEHLPHPLGQADFRRVVTEAVADDLGAKFYDHPLNTEDMAVIKQLHDKKYKTWAWNYGQAPTFNLQRDKRFSFGEIDIRLQIEAGHIRHCSIFGDFFSNADMAELAGHLRDRPYEGKSLEQAIAAIDIQHYFPQLSAADFLNLLID